MPNNSATIEGFQLTHQSSWPSSQSIARYNPGTEHPDTSEKTANTYRGNQGDELVRVERDPRRVPRDVIELPQLRVAPVPIIGSDVLDLLGGALCERVAVETALAQ